MNTYEKELQSFQGYSFNQYSKLEAINAFLNHLIRSESHLISDKQTALNLSVEIENELEELNRLRYAQNKDADFGVRVNATLHIIKQLKPYVAEQHTPQTGFWYKMRRLFRG